MSKPNPRYLYVASPGGGENQSPCKIGISYNPAHRMSSIRSNPMHSYGEEIDLVKIYECEGQVLATRRVENEYRDAFREQTLPRAEEWFEFEADVLIDALDDDERCNAIPPEEISN